MKEEHAFSEDARRTLLFAHNPVCAAHCLDCQGVVHRRDAPKMLPSTPRKILRPI
jgi:hypothetical protein